MKRRIKSYLVFTSFWYRTGVFLLMPAALAGIGARAGSRFGQLGVLGAAMLLTMGEVISDHWLFSGLLAKDAEKLDVLKTSGMGMEILGHALILDLLRKLLTVLVLLAFCSLFSGHFSGLLPMALVFYTFSAAGTFLSRYMGGFQANCWIGQCAAVLACLLYGVQGGLPWFDLLFPVLAILVSVLTVKKTMGKVKGGYYDQ